MKNVGNTLIRKNNNNNCGQKLGKMSRFIRTSACQETHDHPHVYQSAGLCQGLGLLNFLSSCSVSSFANSLTLGTREGKW